MRRRKITSVYEANIPFKCRKEACGAEFVVAPGKLEKERTARCPKCGDVRHLTADDVLQERSENVRNLTQAHKAAFRPKG